MTPVTMMTMNDGHGDGETKKKKPPRATIIVGGRPSSEGAPATKLP